MSTETPTDVKLVSTLERRITVVAVVVPFLAFLFAVYAAWGGLFGWRDLAIMAVMYVAIGLGITIGFHRLFTHRSFEAKPWLRGALAIFGSMAVQGAVIHWVADHRKHHTFADQEGDPHSPHTHGGEGLRAIVGGLWHAHLGWLIERDKEHISARRYAPDLLKDPLIRRIDALFPLWVTLGLAIPFALGFAIGGTLEAGLTALLWGGFVRIFLLHHATWSVNSICHMFGTRSFDSKDESRDNWAVAIVSLGEGWHHGHHAFPTSARHGLSGKQIDPSYATIKLWEKLGWASDVKLPKASQLEAKRIKSDGPADPPAPTPRREPEPVAGT